MTDSVNEALAVPVSTVLDPALWRERYAYGLALGRVAAGSTASSRLAAAAAGGCGKVESSRSGDCAAIDSLPDHVIRWHLRVALSELELKLGTPMGVAIIKSTPVDDGLVLGTDYDREVTRLPYTHAEAKEWFRLDLPSPVISVERVRAYYFGQRIWEISGDQGNANLIRIAHNGRQGVINILPTSLQSIAVTQGGNYGVWQTLFLHKSPVPDFWAVDYTTGPITNDGQVGKIEAVLAAWAYARASLWLLSLGGIGRTGGLSSLSVSMDGVSRSVSVSPTLYKELVDTYKDLNESIDWKALRTNKRGLRLRMFAY